MLFIDTETFNAEKDISAGTYEYTRTCEVLLVTYSIDWGPVRLWDLTENEGNYFAPFSPPGELRDALLTNEPIVAHNAMFDRNVLRYALGVKTDISRWQCTMVKAMSHGFPGSLDQVGRILGLPEDQAKLKTGKALINRFCKPAPANHKARRYTRETHPELWQQFCDYACQDIVAMREIYRRLPSGNDEWPIYHIDQTINDRGFFVDRELVEAGAHAAATEKEALAVRFEELTGGAVTAPTQREKFRCFLNDTFGLRLLNTQSQTFKDLIAVGGIPDAARELMEISISANKTSTAKYATLEPAISPDNRFRGGLQYCGAARTRRWAGRTFQPHNLPSRGLPSSDRIEMYIRALKNGSHTFLFDDLMHYGSAALRGVVIAPPGKQLVVADLSNIEGRANAWLAWETWKLNAFTAFDQGEGPDLYKITAAAILGKTPEDVTKIERNVLGKVPELALGYEGGVGAFQTFSQAYGVKMADHWETIQASLDPRFVDQAEQNYAHWGAERAKDIDPIEWLASETVKLAWRDRHPAIVRLWRACKDAAVNAIRNPGQIHDAGAHLKFKAGTVAEHDYLFLRMPSGKYLTYFDPRLEDDKLSYMGLNGVTRQWERQYTYGGKLVENACQSMSRDILAQSMPRIEKAGYEIVLTVHDEILTEAPATPEYTAEHLAELMTEIPEWARGFPLAAAGFVATRYRKD